MVAFCIFFVFGGAAMIAATISPAEAAGALEGGGRQALNIPAIAMCFVFVAATLGITYWAAQRTRSAADFYAAGAALPDSRMDLQLLATTCRRRHFSEFPGWSSRPASTV